MTLSPGAWRALTRAFLARKWAREDYERFLFGGPIEPELIRGPEPVEAAQPADGESGETKRGGS